MSHESIEHSSHLRSKDSAHLLRHVSLQYMLAGMTKDEVRAALMQPNIDLGAVSQRSGVSRRTIERMRQNPEHVPAGSTVLWLARALQWDIPTKKGKA